MKFALIIALDNPQPTAKKILQESFKKNGRL